MKTTSRSKVVSMCRTSCGAKRVSIGVKAMRYTAYAIDAPTQGR